jgi:hypothetical protein
LRLEAEELEQQLAAQAETEKGKDGAAANGKTTQPSPEALLAQVRALRVGLGNLNGGSADGQDPRVASRVADARTLLQALENGSIGQSETGTAATSDATAGVAPAAVTGSTALAEVEERLAALESIVGSNQGVLEEVSQGALKCRPLDSMLTAMPIPLRPSLDSVAASSPATHSSSFGAHLNATQPASAHRRNLEANQNLGLGARPSLRVQKEACSPPWQPLLDCRYTQ